MLEPKQDKIDLSTAKTKEKRENAQRMEELKDKIRILIETPLFLNGELIDNDLFCPSPQPEDLKNGK